jgi:hypothetical protein
MEPVLVEVKWIIELDSHEILKHPSGNKFWNEE